MSREPCYPSDLTDEPVTRCFSYRTKYQYTVAGCLVEWAQRALRVIVEIVRKPAGQKGFQVQPRRWVVERTLAWPTTHRRLARDYERHPATSEAVIRWAAINTMIRRLTRGRPAARPGPRTLEFTT